MSEFVFATGNPNKVSEIQALVPSHIKIVPMSEIGISDDIPEPFFTLEENAKAKADYLYQKRPGNCFGEDTGLEIEALDGLPGVLSARFAGNQKDSNANMIKVLDEMQGMENRAARFRTVIHAIINKQHHSFEGIIEGTITEFPIGEKGFGYDPIFIPNGYDITFAEMDKATKGSISHRGRALEQFLLFLNRMK